ncbi:site-2 protease family protein [Gemmobacter lanyuensis]
MIGLIGVLLVSIFLHELGHAWAAHVQGVKVTRIILTGAGGKPRSPIPVPRRKSSSP